ncbi:MAG: hypothetical protein U5M50_11125 [Sphingobium sp.]|nr:hypothetical protein [Sphingobium sp.]
MAAEKLAPHQPAAPSTLMRDRQRRRLMEWVTARELETALSSLGNSASIFNAICGRVEGGRLRVQAESITVSGKPTEDQSILRRLFALKERLEGSWNVGDFSGLLNRNRYQFMRVQAFGVRFHREDAEAMGAVFDGPSQLSGAPLTNLMDCDAAKGSLTVEETSPTPPKRSRMTAQQVEVAYATRVREADAAGLRFTREQDELFLKSIGASGAIRDRSRDLRAKYAAHWTSGRPNSGD